MPALWPKQSISTTKYTHMAALFMILIKNEGTKIIHRYNVVILFSLTEISYIQDSLPQSYTIPRKIELFGFQELSPHLE